MPKFGTKVPHLRWDSRTSFKVKRSKVMVSRPINADTHRAPWMARPTKFKLLKEPGEAAYARIRVASRQAISQVNQGLSPRSTGIISLGTKWSITDKGPVTPFSKLVLTLCSERSSMLIQLGNIPKIHLPPIFIQYLKLQNNRTTNFCNRWLSIWYAASVLE